MSRPAKKQEDQADTRTRLERLHIPVAPDGSELEMIDSNGVPCFVIPQTAEMKQVWAETFATLRDFRLNRMRVDHFTDDPILSQAFADLILGTASELSRETAGILLADVVEKLTADEAESFFKRVVLLKRNHEGLPHRNHFAYLAYSRYIEATGKEPTKPQLRKYIEARPEEFRDQPQDKTGWTRLWKESGLFSLPQG